MSKGVVYGKGINNMEYGWTSENDWNYRVYTVWKHMLKRCYSEKWHKRHPTYKNCYVCERWLTLSNFVEDIVKIPNYEYWRDNPNQRISLDKDIKSNGQNKCYCLENCCFTTNKENCKQATKGQLVAQIDKNTNKILNLKYNSEYSRLGFSHSSISECCKKRHKTHKDFIWKYISDCTEEQLQEYYESH